MKTSWKDLISYEDIIDQFGSLQPWVDGLIQTCTLSETEKQQAESLLPEIDDNEELAEIVIMHLLKHQPNRIHSGMNYSMKDIHDLLKKL